MRRRLDGGGGVSDVTLLAEQVGVLEMDEEQYEVTVSDVVWALAGFVAVVACFILVGLMEGGY